MANAPQRGALIAIEGLDRSGKSTQCQKLLDHLQSKGQSAELLRFPDRTTPIGKLISSFLQSTVPLPDQSIHLCFSANRWELASRIEALLVGGKHVILDRYIPSGIVYSISKQSKPFPLSWALAPEVGLPAPDAVLFLNVSEQIAESRGGWGEEKYETRETQRRVRDAFAELQEVWTRNVGPWIEIDAGVDLDTVTARIVTAAAQGIKMPRTADLIRIKPFS